MERALKHCDSLTGNKRLPALQHQSSTAVKSTIFSSRNTNLKYLKGFAHSDSLIDGFIRLTRCDSPSADAETPESEGENKQQENSAAHGNKQSFTSRVSTETDETGNVCDHSL